VKGHINLNGYRIIPDENLFHGKYGLRLVHDTEKSHFFVHDDADNMKGWMKAMIKSTIARDSKGILIHCNSSVIIYKFLYQNILKHFYIIAPVISSSNIATISLAEARKLTPRPPDQKRHPINSTAINLISSPILRPISPLSQRAGSPIPTRPLSPALQTIHN
jgi:hypothetical protein